MGSFGTRRLEEGQALVQFALMAMGLMAMVALGVDVGLLAVQKRFDQNAADAAALAAAKSLTSAIGVNGSGQVVFAAGGLTAAQSAVTSLAVANAHAGLASRTTRVAELELSPNGGADWFCSAAAPCSSGPPTPVPPNPYLVRIRVASKTTGFFAGFLNPSPAAGCPDPSPGVSGMTSCAQTVVSVSGTPNVPTGMQVIPATLPDCAVRGSTAWQVFELWGSNQSPCHDTGGWKNLLDFTPFAPQTDPDFGDFHNQPGGPSFTPDPVYTDASGRRRDLVYWIANGFGGEVHIGNRVLTGQSGTAEGCISRGFYGGGGACDVNGRSDDHVESYFFDNSKLTGAPGSSGAPGSYGWFDCSDVRAGDPVVQSGMRVGCRDVAIAAWGVPQVRQGQTWVGISSGAPDRVEIVAFYVFRFYCGWSSDNTQCNQRPPSSVLPGCPSMGSGICGRLSPAKVTGSCPMCVAEPSATANALRLRD